MKPTKRISALREREFRGSRLRCLLLTSGAHESVATFLNSLVAPHALVSAEDRWAPRGFVEPDEAKLGETPGFLCDVDRKALTQWWLSQPGRANTPNWDLVSTCRISNRPGLVLIEAKAHVAEFSDDGCSASNPNREQIENALREATSAWDALVPGFALSPTSHYQLSNRFAFAWKLATMGVPVVLLYLGFLDAHEMAGGSRILLKDHEQWRSCVLSRSKGTVPEDVWGKSLDLNGTPLTVLIGSAAVGVYARSAGNGAAV